MTIAIDATKGLDISALPVMPPEPVELIEEALGIPDLDDVVGPWSYDQILEFDRRCAVHAARVAAKPYEAAMEAWRVFFAHHPRPDISRARKDWFESFCREIGIPDRYPKTFFEKAPEIRVVRGVRIAIRPEDSLADIYDKYAAACPNNAVAPRGSNMRPQGPRKPRGVPEEYRAIACFCVSLARAVEAAMAGECYMMRETQSGKIYLASLDDFERSGHLADVLTDRRAA